MPLVRMLTTFPFHDRIFGSGLVYNVNDKIFGKIIAAGAGVAEENAAVLPKISAGIRADGGGDETLPVQPAPVDEPATAEEPTPEPTADAPAKTKREKRAARAAKAK